MQECPARHVARKYLEVSRHLLTTLEDGDLEMVDALLIERASLTVQMEAALEDVRDPEAVRAILQEVVEVDQSIEEGLQLARERVSEHMGLLQAYQARGDRSFEARAYDQKG